MAATKSASFKSHSSKKSSSSTNACWPGYTPVPGKKHNEKGSCRPKKRQTAKQREGDRRAAAASKLSGSRSK